MAAPKGNTYAKGNPGGGAPAGNRNAAGNSGGKVGRSGPPKNCNSVKHGVYHYLSTGELPVDVQAKLEQFVADLDQQIANQYGSDVPLEIRCERETAITNLAIAHLRARWAGQDDLTIEARDKIVHGVLSALDKRDSKVRAMKLSPRSENAIWDCVYARDLTNVGEPRDDSDNDKDREHESGESKQEF